MVWLRNKNDLNFSDYPTDPTVATAEDGIGSNKKELEIHHFDRFPTFFFLFSNFDNWCCRIVGSNPDEF